MIRHFQLRFVLLCAMLLAAAAMVAPSRAEAQNDVLCRCDYITVNVELGVRCKVTVCMLIPDGTKNCVTVAPGTRARLRCIPGGTIYIIDCRGELVPLNPDGCTLGIGAGGDCCTVDACLAKDANGCLVINIRPSILDVCPCL
jgi:hypothetical protein